MSSRTPIYGTVFLVGFCGLVAQVVVLREMVVTFYGNELSIGVMLAAWLLWTGVGSLGLGRLTRRTTRSRLWLAAALVGGALVLGATVGAARCLGLVLRLGGETLGATRPFRLMLLSSLALLAPFCLLNGLLFPLACRVAGQASGDERASVGRVYLAEAAGAGAGGACYSFVLVHWVGSVTLACLLAAAWCVAAGALAATERGGAVAKVLLCAAVLIGVSAGAACATGWSARLEAEIDTACWRPLRLVRSADSRFGRVAVVRPPQETAQRSLYRNGAVAFSYPDPPAAESVAHLPMLEHRAPKRVLLLGGGLGGVLAEILKHPSVEKVIYVELDPLVVGSVLDEFPPAAGKALRDGRVEVVLGDGRRFLKRTGRRFDVVINAIGPPSTAQTNRYYTLECFREVARALAPGGIFAFRAAGGHNYIQDENRRLLASLHRTLTAAFPHAIAFPGAQCTFLASNRDGVLSYRLDVLGARLVERGVTTSHVDVATWEAGLVGGRLEELEEALATEATVNRDLSPRCYYFEAQRWSAEQRARGPGARRPWVDLGRVLAAVERRPWVVAVVVLGLVVAASLTGPVMRRQWRDGAANFVVASTGVVEMAVQFVVLLGFQVAYGYVYQYVGILIASFMVGLALGAWKASEWVSAGKATWRRLAWVQACICAYPLVLLGFLLVVVGTRLGASPLFAGLSFSAVALAAGWVGGMQFPVAAALHSGGVPAAGALYALDLFGACVGALAVSSVLVPVFGMCWVCVMLSALGGLGLVAVAAAARSGRRKTC